MTELATRRSERDAARARRRVRPRDLAVVATIALFGIGVLLYPAGASWFSALVERGAVTGYVERVAELPTHEVAAARSAAQQYNMTLVRGLIVDPFSNTSAGETPLDADARAYLDQLDIDPSGVMARIQIPKIGVDLPVFHGATEETLRKGIGHLYGSSMPVGGPGTHAVLTGHSGLPEARLFDDIRELEIGDEFSVTTLGETLTYRVALIDTVDPTDIADLGTSAGRDLVTLVTCTPIGINSHRLIVQGERVDGPATTTEMLGADHIDFPWWAVAFGAALVVWLIILVRAVRARGA